MSRNHPISTLYVRNISDRVRYDDITRLFERYGKIVDIRIPIDYNSRSSRGFAFVQFQYASDAEEALYKLDKKTLMGREIEVEFARFDRKSANEMRNRAPARKEYRDNGHSNGHGRSNSRRTRSRSRSRDRKNKERGTRRKRSRDRSQSSSSSRSPSNDRSSHTRIRDRRGSRSPYKNHNGHNKSISKDRVHSSMNNKSPHMSLNGSPNDRGNSNSPRGRTYQKRRTSEHSDQEDLIKSPLN